MMSMASRKPVICYLRIGAVGLCLSVCASMMLGGCSKREEPQQPQKPGLETPEQQKMRKDKSGD